jgi:hypothetical protein
MALLGRAQIIRAVRVRKLLEQADGETGPASAAFEAKAARLARSCPPGFMLYKDRQIRLGEEDDDDGHPDLSGHRDDEPAP